MERRRAKTTIARIERMRHSQSKGRLIYVLHDPPVTLWYNCSGDYAKYQLQKREKCIGRCDFEWTYDKETGEIFKGPHHPSCDDSSERDPHENCTLL